MLELLRDSVWQFVGAVVGALGIAVTVILALLLRLRKALEYKTVYTTPLVHVGKGAEGRVAVYFDGQPVSQVHLVAVEVFNAGNAAIRTSDYERPITILPGSGAKILSAKVTQTNPENLTPAIAVEEGRVVVEPLLLNRGDAFTLELLLCDFGGVLAIDARIVGVKKVRQYEGPPGLRPTVLLFSGAFLFLLGVSTISLIGPATRLPAFVWAVLLVACMLGWSGVTLGLLSGILRLTSRHRKEEVGTPKGSASQGQIG